MAKVTGIGGVFFKSPDPEKLKKWYKEHLGIDYDQYGRVFKWQDGDAEGKGSTTWCPFVGNTKYFSPSDHDYMINYRVDDLIELLGELDKKGIKQVGEMEDYPYGKFAWIMDPEGRKIELWEPIDDQL
ncbi:VOC family protein [Mangrovivirga sp. M17]|uniref:VOC family protein n=1 Tax=Mangrovivirga halotolerans TaxID=2993936 RepID=A0ABT3RPR6_9BACT|nr:VOC family protein [Mangrovivirga halotolerans]MCX2743626.1 VOC family protein [Mangrovivirga halotolerans]